MIPEVTRVCSIWIGRCPKNWEHKGEVTVSAPAEYVIPYPTTAVDERTVIVRVRRQAWSRGLPDGPPHDGEVAARRRALNERAPGRDLLAAIYRVLRRGHGERPVTWPDDGVWAELSGALPDLARAAVDAALAIFEEAGLAAREVIEGRSEVQLLSISKGDLTASWRYREGRRERDAFEDVARWALRASGIELLRAAAGDGGAP